MSAEQESKVDGGLHLESVDRIAKLPVVETTLQTGKNIYDKVKDYNSVTNWTVSTAESTVTKAVEIGKPYAVPVINTFEGPIKKVDGLMCTGLDYVESKVPAVKLPPGEMFFQLYNSTKEYVTNLGPVQTAMHYVDPAVQGAKHYVEPAIEGAKCVTESAVQGAKSLVGGSLDTANAIKDYGTHKVEEFIGTSSNTEADQHQDGKLCVENKYADDGGQ